MLENSGRLISTGEVSFRILPHISIKNDVTFHRPDQFRQAVVDPKSPALEVMTDLRKTSAVTIHPMEAMDAAQKKMIQRSVRMLLVIDYTDDIIGILTANDLLGEKPIQVVGQNGGSVAALRVQDVMTPREDIDFLTIQEVSRAKVGDIIETLRNHNRQHALVVDNQGPRNELTIRGIFSLTQIARQMGMQIQTYDVPHNLSEIAQFMAKNHP